MPFLLNVTPYAHPSLQDRLPSLWIIPYVLETAPDTGLKDIHVAIRNPHGDRVARGEDTGPFIHLPAGPFHPEERGKSEDKKAKNLRLNQAQKRILSFFMGQIPHPQMDQKNILLIEGTTLFSGEKENQAVIVANVLMGRVRSAENLNKTKTDPRYRGSVHWMSLPNLLADIKGEPDAEKPFCGIKDSPFTVNRLGLNFHVQQSVLYVLERFARKFPALCSNTPARISEAYFLEQHAKEVSKLQGPPDRAENDYLYRAPGFALAA